MGFPKDSKVGDAVFRAEITHLHHTDPEVQYTKAQITKVTPCGAWVKGDYYLGWYPFATKQWHTTKEGALESLKKRSVANYKYQRARFEDAKDRLAALGIEEPRPMMHFPGSLDDLV